MAQLVVTQMAELQLDFPHQLTDVFFDLVLGLRDDREPFETNCAQQLPLLTAATLADVQPSTTGNWGCTCNVQQGSVTRMF